MYVQKKAWPVLAASVLVLVGCDSQNPTALEDELPTTIVEPSDMANATYWPTTSNSFRSLGTQSTDLLSAHHSSGVVIDFESLAATGGSFTFLTTYSEDGFTLVNASSPTSLSAFASPHTDNAGWFVSSPALFNNFVDGVTVLTKDDGGTFNVTSIDVSELPPFGTAPRTVPFTGTRPDGSTVSATFMTDGPIGFETFAFSGFTNLTSLSWVQVPQFHQFDNIVVNIVVVGDLVVTDADIRRKPEHNNHDRFQVRGTFTLGEDSDGIDPANEDVTVTLDGFSETIPAGAFSPLKFHRWQYLGPDGGALERVLIFEDGRFLVIAEAIDLTGIDLDNVPFSLLIGDDIGETTIGNENP